MKRYRIIIFAIIAVVFSACGETFLDTEPLTKKTDGNYYSTPAEVNEALVGCYDGLQLIYSEGTSTIVAADVMSDLCFGGTGAGDGEGYPMMDEFDLSLSPTDVNMFEATWKSYYKGIFRCNQVINKIDQADWAGNESQRNSILGEARFLRAYYYFDLVRMFGRVPLLTVASEENIPQSDPDETYKVIAEDLLYAVDNCSATSYDQIATTDYGHATKWAAESMLARVYLYYTGYYGKPDLLGLVTKAKALLGVEDVITNSGYGLLENFGDLWPAASTYAAGKAGLPITESTYVGETNKEIVFAIKYTYTSDYNGNLDGNHWLVMNGLRGQSWAKSGYGSGWGACTVPAEVYANWDAKDQRRSASIMAIAEEGVTYTDAMIKDVKEYTGYFTKKYTPTCDETGASNVTALGGVNFMIGQYQDYFVMRYSDVLLMAAELGSSNALQYVNDVHVRAGLTPLAAVDKDVIYEERRVEFAFEGIRYWDLLRYDSSLDYAASKVAFSGTVKTGGVEMAKTIDGANLIKTKGLWIIPNNQITLSNNVLEQNAGWE